MTMTVNPIVLPIAAFVPMLLGLVWFHPALLGRFWRKAGLVQGTTPQLHSFSVLQLLTFYLLSFLVAFFLLSYVNHQMSVQQLFFGQPNFGNPEAASTKNFEAVMAMVGDRHMTWGHGAFHGFILSVVLILPILAHGAMRERRGFRPILIYWSYWALCTVIMGAILGGWGVKVL